MDFGGDFMKKITMIVLALSISFLIGYDIYAILIDGSKSSISAVIIEFSYKMPFFTFMAGVLCGHLFWRMKPNESTKEIDK